MNNPNTNMENDAVGGEMEFGENDIFIAMEEGDFDGEELDDLDDTDRAAALAGLDAASDEDEAQAAIDGDTSMEPLADHAVHQCTEHQGMVVCVTCVHIFPRLFEG